MILWSNDFDRRKSLFLSDCILHVSNVTFAEDSFKEMTSFLILICFLILITAKPTFNNYAWMESFNLLFIDRIRLFSTLIVNIFVQEKKKFGPIQFKLLFEIIWTNNGKQLEI